ncbi:PREDICTED: U-box domain-containing protein 35 isoform X2 [Tarenaya hassleriana]|uniref:U-box domain-containing protein 35 isoform X2 n=1 Tax=Tarenaya hassleriana TaxID=28532 RepID=UPI0008FD0C85|nr:PREDICTED: U-box domain-containing protein 35 isoform X2 [Tarenaya hassleriana]
MKSYKGNVKKKGTNSGLVAVAIDNDKGSQHALKWTADNLVSKGQTIILIHVVLKSSVSGESNTEKQRIEKQTKDLFMTFRCYCTRKEIHCLDVTLEDDNVVKALTEYTSFAVIETLVLGATSRHGFMRKFKMSDTPSSVSKGAPDFCTVYVISKGKVSSLRHASRLAPYASPIMTEVENQSAISSYEKFKNSMSFKDRALMKPSPTSSVEDYAKSPFARRSNFVNSFYDFSDSEADISFVSSGRPSMSSRPSTSTTGRTDMSFMSSGRPSTSTTGSSFICEFPESGLTPRLSTNSGQSIGSLRLGIRFNNNGLPHDFSFVSQDSARTSCSQSLEEVEVEMRRLKQELKHTIDMYGTACREALAAKQEAKQLQRQKTEEEGKFQDEQISEKATKSLMEKERANKVAAEATQTANRIVELETQRRTIEHSNSLEDSMMVMSSFSSTDARYRRYTIGEIEVATDSFEKSNKIGEGGYGPVFKGFIDHTAVAVKVLRPDAAQGRSQFQREVEVLSCIRHPNMVLLIGACPEYGVLVYEYMAKGSLADRLYRHSNTPALSWQLRFRIAAEVATGLLFLHQTKPEPIVHRDLKPGNILLDQNYVSKIGDVGLARLVPAVAENVTQCHVTSTAGTFFYIDPEYQQTGMLGVKSDVYSFGILLLELLTAKRPTGLAYNVEQAIEQGVFKEMLDPVVPDWPVEEALSLAKLALHCAELRRKDRPDLGNVVLPELNRLRAIADESMDNLMFGHRSRGPSPSPSQVFAQATDVNSESSKTMSSTSSDIEICSDQTEEG